MKGAPTNSRERSGRIVTLVLAIGLYGAVGGYLYHRTVSQLNRAGVVEPVDAPKLHPGMVDFRDATYFPVVALRHGHDPYDVTDYLARFPVAEYFPPYGPHYLLLAYPLAFLHYHQAELIFFIMINLLLALPLAWAVLAGLGLDWGIAGTFALAAVVLGGTAGRYNALIGQPSLLIVFGCFLAIGAARSRPWVAGIGLSLAMLKPGFGIPLACCLLVLGRLRAIGWGAAVTAAASTPVLVALALQRPGVTGLGRSLLHNLAYTGHSPGIGLSGNTVRIDAVGVLSRWTGRAPPGWLQIVGSLGLAGLALIGIALVGRRSDDQPIHRMTTSALTTVMVLVCVEHQPYELMLLTWPLVEIGAWVVSRIRVMGMGTFVAWRRNWLLPIVGLALLITYLNPVTAPSVERSSLPHLPDSRNLVSGVSLLLAYSLLVIVAVRSRRRRLHQWSPPAR